MQVQGGDGRRQIRERPCNVRGEQIALLKGKSEFLAPSFGFRVKRTKRKYSRRTRWQERTEKLKDESLHPLYYEGGEQK
jgi:hypothetical protein